MIHTTSELIYKGILLGIITAFSFGPVFFTIIETSIRRGYRYAISIAVGVLISDAIIISACFLGMISLLQNSEVRNIIGVVGGSMLIMFGIYHIIHSTTPGRYVEITDTDHSGVALFVVKGLLINTLNPFVFVYWLSAMSLVSVNHEYAHNDKVLLFTTAVMCNFGFDLFKTFLAIKLKHFMTPRTISLISKAVGCGIIYFGVRLLWKTLVI